MAAKPEAREEVLHDNHTHSNHHGVGDAQLVIAGQAVAAEDGTADDGLQQIVGETHATEDAQVMEHTAHTLEGIPCRDNSRDYHQEDDEVVDGLEPHVEITKVHEAQTYDKRCRYAEDDVPDLQVPALVVKKPLPS